MADRPTRVQLSRAKGWRMPENTVSVARPTVFGNPFTVEAAREVGYRGDDDALRDMCVRSFRLWLGDREAFWSGPDAEARRAAILSRLPSLRGKNLACWCKLGSPCHADVLLELANKETDNG
jgi:hypothetical protein